MRERVDLKSPVRENCTPGSVRGGTGQPVSLPRRHEQGVGDYLLAVAIGAKIDMVSLYQ
jgi:hypothetical protein